MSKLIGIVLGIIVLGSISLISAEPWVSAGTVVEYSSLTSGTSGQDIFRVATANGQYYFQVASNTSKIKTMEAVIMSAAANGWTIQVILGTGQDGSWKEITGVTTAKQ